MNETRKKILLNEIRYWKKTRILPEQYCNYLLALYSEGEDEQLSTPKKKMRKITIPYVFISIIIVSAFIVNYFTEIKTFLQIALYIILLGTLIGITFYENKKQRIISFPLIAISLVTLMMTVSVWEIFASGQVVILYMLLFINCLIWTFIGKKMNLPYFTTAGVFGSIVILYFFLKYFGLFQ
ncbi:MULTISPECIES: hypothetical protein [Bacillus]|uniref:hypothetical protein n=1 Tax=Bacillus TaxID=1386 RepID=UPI0002FB2168|nr:MULTISPECIES: hypothetical protein [Bacillus]